MILAISQDASTIVSVTGGDPAFDASDLLDYTFDTNYNSGGTIVDFDFDLDADNSTFVGIAGHNLGTLGCTISIRNHDTLDVVNYAPIDDRPIMLTIPARSGGSIDKVRVEITKQSTSDIAVISHMVTGRYTDFTSVTSNGQIITRDYSAGFPRIPMGLGRKSRAILNQSAAPTATLIKTISQKVRLNVEGIAENFVSDELVTYQNFWVNNAFFIQNDDDNSQVYMAMQFMPVPPKTHSSTRELLNVSYSFLAYNGL